jgi:hypothetical protein
MPKGYPVGWVPPPPLTDEQKRLAGDHTGVAWWVVRTRHRRLIRLAGADEVRSTAMWALVNAARTFDPTRGVAFKTHAARAVDLRLRRLFNDSLASRRRGVEVLSITDLNAQPHYDGEGMLYEDHVTGGREHPQPEDDRDDVRLVRELADGLPPSMRRVVLECLTGRHPTNRSVGAALGHSGHYVGLALGEAAKRLAEFVRGRNDQ